MYWLYNEVCRYVCMLFYLLSNFKETSTLMVAFGSKLIFVQYVAGPRLTIVDGKGLMLK